MPKQEKLNSFFEALADYQFDERFKIGILQESTERAPNDPVGSVAFTRPKVEVHRRLDTPV